MELIKENEFTPNKNIIAFDPLSTFIFNANSNIAYPMLKTCVYEQPCLPEFRSKLASPGV